MLDALGHCDSIFDSAGEGIVYVGPPTLAALPIPGLPRAVVCGSRSPDTLALLLRARTQAGGRIRVSNGRPATVRRWLRHESKSKVKLMTPWLALPKVLVSTMCTHLLRGQSAS